MKLKKSVKRILIILLLIIVAIVGICIYIKNPGNKKVKKVKVVSQIEEYGYTLKDSKNKAYQEEFKNLKQILSEKEVDEEKYAKSISKLFIIDFFSLEDKLAKTDVGGTEFVHSEEVSDFLEKAEDTMYKYVESNLYGGRVQKLPSVESVTIDSIEKEEFIYLETKDEAAYKVNVSWTYTNSNGEGYQTEGSLILVHEGKKLSVAEFE